ncbi:MAG: efflux RND transporter periplasmic adaptor subunit [Bryobacterales bacterium]|nr:efflux RND transporter periplasmic adaptor subunit [Bryobacterales bacterium]MDE0629215.1 efflux RND transporter periplasmic adaptor subunit [Bryobacterales bacterium]
MTAKRLFTVVLTVAALAAAAIAIRHIGARTEGESPEIHSSVDSGAAGLYTCGMHPQVMLEGPGQCPICGMNLTPIESRPAPPAAAAGPGVHVSRNFLQNFAVRTAIVERADLPARIRTIGYLEHDEARLVSVHTKFEGWIERPRVNIVGETVSKGEVLFEIYSPDLVAVQEEFLAEIAFVDRLREMEAYPGAVSRAEAHLQAAEDRLRRWDLTSQQIEHLRAAGKASRTVEVYSPGSGYVVDKQAESLEGIKAVPGTTILTIADHSTLWAKVEFFEHHLEDLRVGLTADISLDAFPRRRWRGRLLFFEPSMSPETQTLTGYVEVENSDGRLRPKMYATIEIQLPGAKDALIVPAQAVLRSGKGRDIVIIDAGNGIFVPREIELGIESEGLVHVSEGLAEGERVVTSSQFLLDSESNLQAAVDRLADSTVGGHLHVH